MILKDKAGTLITFHHHLHPALVSDVDDHARRYLGLLRRNGVILGTKAAKSLVDDLNAALYIGKHLTA